MLEIQNLYVYHGSTPALKGVSFKVAGSQTVAVTGNRGAGKSTLMRTISGLDKPHHGSISFEGRSIEGLSAHKISRMGMVQVMEQRNIAPHMTVFENLEVGAYFCRDKKQFAANLDRVYAIFPELPEKKSRVAGTLSRGEQQMLALGRGLMAGPRMLLLDEPCQGLAPILVERLAEAIRLLRKERPLPVLMAEEYPQLALLIADQRYVLQAGRMAAEGQEIVAPNRAEASAEEGFDRNLLAEHTPPQSPALLRKWLTRKHDRRREVHQAMEAAANEAQKGEPDLMNRFLDEAARKARLSRMDIADNIKSIQQTGYEKALEAALEQAADLARQGNTGVAASYLKMAERHAARLEGTAQNRVREARTSLGIETGS